MFVDYENNDEINMSSSANEIVHSLNCGKTNHDFSDLVNDCFDNQDNYFSVEVTQNTRITEDDNRNCEFD